MAEPSPLRPTGLAKSHTSEALGDLLQLGVMWLGIWGPALLVGWLVAKGIAMLPFFPDPQTAQPWSIGAGLLAWLAMLLTTLLKAERGGGWKWLPNLFAEYYLPISLAGAFVAGIYVVSFFDDSKAAQYVARACYLTPRCMDRAEQLSGDEYVRAYVLDKLPSLPR